MSEESWINTGSGDKGSNILIGIEHLPTPIITHMRRTLNNRPMIEHVYHITELIYCLRKAYYRRLSKIDEYEIPEIDKKGLWNIYRGNTYDNLWSPLFKTNQRTYVISRERENRKIFITGTLDFVWVDEQDLEKVLYDLKMPSTIFYRKKEGAGMFYTHQVQGYLGMAHEKGELTDVHRCRVMMLADDLVIAEVKENDKILDYITDRAWLLDDAVITKNPDILTGPEGTWECLEEYCPGSIEWRLECKNYSKTS